ncbi:sulfite exporter TauE/SafE family protein [Pseudomaricurvus alcaniphilus]|uniref:sulfite exporter TauE/SafE family protein n=1 Tax=Pseudomaricurvus alcaniphilus TaxID=1166482 RepID=UPI00140C70FF|nr:sulfite exporter TauE/SafE family protein [Pseudomaricurvus alcaniphilus]NHN37591.1 sulfite exporter TauE/SafE family protein [Pseudomaricurvus alcaniphilus]
MAELSYLQLALIGLVFVWSGFVRSGLGFGGSVLSLPFLLMIDNQPLVYLPIIAVHLLFFATLTIWQNNRSRSAGATAAMDTRASTVDWAYLWRVLPIMIVPKLVGVFGLLMLPNTLMSLIIFVIVGGYAISYMLNKPFKSNSRTLDIIFLMLGGYISGTSLIGAPLIIAVFMNHVAREKLRDTMFALWVILVSIKMAAFVWAGIDLQLIHHLWLLPCAAVGHVFGLRLHDRLLTAESPVFFRVLGAVLFIVTLLGVYQGVRQL